MCVACLVTIISLRVSVSIVCVCVCACVCVCVSSFFTSIVLVESVGGSTGVIRECLEQQVIGPVHL